MSPQARRELLHAVGIGDPKHRQDAVEEWLGRWLLVWPVKLGPTALLEHVGGGYITIVRERRQS